MIDNPVIKGESNMPRGGYRPGAGRRPAKTKVELVVDPVIQTMGPPMTWDELENTITHRINRMNQKAPDAWTDKEIRVYPLLVKTLEFFKSKAVVKTENAHVIAENIDLGDLLDEVKHNYGLPPGTARRALGP